MEGKELRRRSGLCLSIQEKASPQTSYPNVAVTQCSPRAIDRENAAHQERERDNVRARQLRVRHVLLLLGEKARGSRGPRSFAFRPVASVEDYLYYDGGRQGKGPCLRSVLEEVGWI